MCTIPDVIVLLLHDVQYYYYFNVAQVGARKDTVEIKMNCLKYVVLLKSTINLIVLFAFCGSATAKEGCFHVDPDVCRNVSELITSKGYPCEEHTVRTKDGFLLGIQRIPHGVKQAAARRPVVFLQHGLLDSSATWVENLANISLGFILADAGYDVWLGNVRGNVYSRKHVHLKPFQNKFWAWSWDEMATFDLPAMIDYVVGHTKQQQLYYIGHSQGTTIAFAQLSKDSKLREQIKVFIALGPVTEVGHIESPVRYLSVLVPEIKDLFDILGIQEFLPKSELIKLLGVTLCNAQTRFICEDIIFVINGPDYKNLNQSRIPVYLGHTPAGTSVQNIVHFAQMVRSGQFQMYDYGSAQLNMHHYKQKVPPVYNVSAVTTPVVLMSGGRDWLADRQDVAVLKSKLPNILEADVIKHWNHVDFIWATDAPSMVYRKIIQILKTHPIY